MHSLCHASATVGLSGTVASLSLPLFVASSVLSLLSLLFIVIIGEAGYPSGFEGVRAIMDVVVGGGGVRGIVFNIGIGVDRFVGVAGVGESFVLCAVSVVWWNLGVCCQCVSWCGCRVQLCTYGRSDLVG